MRKRLTLLGTELGTFDRRRERLFSALEAGAMTHDGFAPRLTQLKAREEAAAAECADAERELEATRARGVSITEAWRLLQLAARVWERPSVDDHQAMAWTLGAALGGLVVTSDSMLGFALRATGSRKLGVRS